MAQRRNCFTVMPDGALAPMRFSTKDYTSALFTLESGKTARLPFMLHGGQAEHLYYTVHTSILRSEIVSARPVCQGMWYLDERRAWNGCILHVSAENLNFETHRLRYAVDACGLWPGVETLAPALLRLGDRRTQHHVQVVQAAPGVALFVADKNGNYIEFAFSEDGILVPRQASKKRLCRYLVERTRRGVCTHAALTWAKKTLCGLNMGHLWPSDLEESLRRQQC